MTALEKGITANGEGYRGKTWNILGQVYFPKAVTDSTFAFETNSEPGQFVPVHVHPTQDEFILVQEGVLDLKLDGVWVKAKAGDLVRMPRGIPHGYFNKSDKPARALFWVSPMQKLEALFDKLHNLTDPAEVVRISAQHEVDFLPPEANDQLQPFSDKADGTLVKVVVLGGSKSGTNITVNAVNSGASEVTIVYREPVWRDPQRASMAA